MAGLDKLLTIQKQFTTPELLAKFPNTVAFAKEIILALNAETYEVLNEMNWKMHTPKDNIELSDVAKHKITIELVDVMKYLLNLNIALEVSGTEFEKQFELKSNYVKYSFETWDVIKKIERPIILVDLDNTLADSDTYVITKFNARHGTKFKTLQDVKRYDISGYEKLKHELRNSLEKMKYTKNLKVVKFLELAKKEFNAEVIIFTARQAKVYPIQLQVVKEWLKNHNIEYTRIVFTKRNEKAETFSKMFVNKNVVMIIDDDKAELKALNDVSSKVIDTEDILQANDIKKLLAEVVKYD